MWITVEIFGLWIWCNHMVTDLWITLWCHFNLCVIPSNISCDIILAEMLEQQLQPEQWGNNYPICFGSLGQCTLNMNIYFSPLYQTSVLSVHHPVIFKATMIMMTSPGIFHWNHLVRDVWRKEISQKEGSIFIVGSVLKCGNLPQTSH